MLIHLLVEPIRSTVSAVSLPLRLFLGIEEFFWIWTWEWTVSYFVVSSFDYVQAFVDDPVTLLRGLRQESIIIVTQ